jgi:hypothetical protein
MMCFYSICNIIEIVMYLSVFSCVMFFDSSGDIQSKNQEKWFSFVAISYSRKYQRSLIQEG